MLDSARQVAASVFSDSYARARRMFLEAAPHAAAYACSAEGPSGDSLYTDAAYFGAPDAKNLLVLVSATHGAEGYCGSACQLAFLRAQLHESMRSWTSVLMIHALNAYGFAWDRRVTAEGCDLNRNFVDFAQGVPANTGYEELADHLVPADISPEGVQAAEEVIRAYRATHGEWKFQVARKSGQYTRPQGMYYGGSAPTQARRTLEQVCRDFEVASRERVIIVDYHTGLGPYGYGELQCEQPSGIAGHERAVKVFGPSATSPDLGTSSSVAITGSQDELWQRLLGDRHTYVCLEYGTYHPDRVREAVRGDHWLFAHRPAEVNADLGRSIRDHTKRQFYPEFADWKEMVVWRAHQVHRQALEALAT